MTDKSDPSARWPIALYCMQYGCRRQWVVNSVAQHSFMVHTCRRF